MYPVPRVGVDAPFCQSFQEFLIDIKGEIGVIVANIALLVKAGGAIIYSEFFKVPQVIIVIVVDIPKYSMWLLLMVQLLLNVKTIQKKRECICLAHYHFRSGCGLPPSAKHVKSNDSGLKRSFPISFPAWSWRCSTVLL